MSFKYYIFDLDNCLLNFEKPSEYFDTVLVETLKILMVINIPQRNERNKFWFSGDNYITMLKNWGVSDLNHFWKHFDETDYKLRKFLYKKGELNLYKDVENVLKDLYSENKKMAIVSNAADYIVDYITEIFNIKYLFNNLFGLSFDKDQKKAKPSPFGIIKVLEKMEYDHKKSSAIMIGDSLLDIYAAKKANILACLIKRDVKKYPDGYQNWDYKPDFEIIHLDELLDL